MKLAIKEKVPFIYISANSGAKIGLAEDIKQLFKVAWNEKDSPEKVYIIYAPNWANFTLF